MAFHILYVTHASEEEARRVSKTLLDARLIACANILPIQSLYWWQGEIEEGQEWVSILKTSASRLQDAVQAVEDLHPYDVPCVMQMEVRANDAYERWIEAETRG